MPGGDQPPSKIATTISVKYDYYRVREQFQQILDLMINYQTEKGDFPAADSAEFYEYVLSNELADMSHHQLQSAIGFLERSFLQHGANAHFHDSYLEQRHQTSKKIWGKNHGGVERGQDNPGSLTQELLAGCDDLHFFHDLDSEDDDNEEDIEGYYAAYEKQQETLQEIDQDDDGDDNQEVEEDFGKINQLDADVQQYNRDIKILLLIQSLYKRNQVIPEANSIELYNLVIESHIDIQQHELADRVINLEEDFNHINRLKMLGVEVNIPNPLRRQVYELSNNIWVNRPPPSPAQGNQDQAGGVYNNLDEEGRDFLDISILMSIEHFHHSSGGVIPEADSVELYNLVTRESTINITQHELFTRILTLEETFNIINTQVMLGEGLNFPNPRRREIYNLSRNIWGGHLPDFYD